MACFLGRPGSKAARTAAASESFPTSFAGSAPGEFARRWREYQPIASPLKDMSPSFGCLVVTFAEWFDSRLRVKLLLMFFVGTRGILKGEAKKLFRRLFFETCSRCKNTLQGKVLDLPGRK